MKRTDVRKTLDKVYKQMEKDNWDMRSVSTYRRELMTELALVPPKASELPSDAEKSSNAHICCMNGEKGECTTCGRM